MRLTRHSIIQWIVLLSVALLVTRIAGNHLHLCLDGSEPAVAMHMLDIDVHDKSHNDTDVNLPSAALAKNFSHLADPLVLVAALVCMLLLPRPQRSSFALVRPLLAYASIRLLRPPLRGPPVLLPR